MSIMSAAPLESDGLCVQSDRKENCGLFGIFGDPEAVQKTYFGLHSLQHRGQDSDEGPNHDDSPSRSKADKNKFHISNLHSLFFLFNDCCIFPSQRSGRMDVTVTCFFRLKAD